MITLTEILKGKVVNCRTEEEANELLLFLHNNGYRWQAGNSLVSKNYWDFSTVNTCYCIYEQYKTISYSTLGCEANAITYQQFKQLIKGYNMETKEVKIQVPEGYEIDKENSTLECIKFKPIKKSLTYYEDVAEKLFLDINAYRIDGFGNIDGCLYHCKRNCFIPNICTSEKQAEKLIAINMLMNVAKYLNGDWKPDWDKPQEKKYYIKVDAYPYNLKVDFNLCYRDGNTYFKAEELAKQAIEILGEDTIKLALSTDW